MGFCNKMRNVKVYFISILEFETETVLTNMESDNRGFSVTHSLKKMYSSGALYSLRKFFL